MTTLTSDDAFDALRKILETSMELVKRKGALAFQKGDLEKVRDLAKELDDLGALGGNLSDLRKQWNQLLDDDSHPSTPTTTPHKPRTRKLKTHKLQKGLRTHEDEYRAPILQSLVALGGYGSVNEVKERVGVIMKPILNEYDYAKLESDPRKARWENSTEWVRLALKKEGLISSDSPAGIWEITEKGRQWLAQRQEPVK